jgi:mannan endo-1,4-beta-mannosidase
LAGKKHHAYKQLLIIMAVCALGSSCVSLPFASPRPANPKASPAARSVLEYLYRVKKEGSVLAAQHIYLHHVAARGGKRNEVEHIHALTGKYPAIIEFDLLGFRENPRKKDLYLDFARQWYEAGGLVAVSWHETSPELPVLDEGGFQHGTKKRMTQDRFNDVLKQGTVLNKRWLEHVDLAAEWLGELRDAGVPVLWRPYHEMTGEWFWWGRKDPESFCALWRMMYDRLTNHHKLDNLVWVWSAALTGRDYAAFLPSDRVDVVGIDMYRRSRDDPFFARFAAIIEKAAQGKPIALTEVGLIPTMDILVNQTSFIWCCIWGKGFLDNTYYPEPAKSGPGNAPECIKEFYAHPKVITRDELEVGPATRQDGQ